MGNTNYANVTVGKRAYCADAQCCSNPDNTGKTCNIRCKCMPLLRWLAEDSAENPTTSAIDQRSRLLAQFPSLLEQHANYYIHGHQKSLMHIACIEYRHKTTEYERLVNLHTKYTAEFI